MHKLQRDLLLTFAIGSSVLVVLGGVVFFLTRPSAPIVAELPPAPVPPVQHAVAAEPIDDPESEQIENEAPPQPEISEAERVSRLGALMRQQFEEFGIKVPTIETVARAVLNNDRESWLSLNGVERGAAGTWYAHKLYPDKSIETKIGIGLLYAQLLNSAYTQVDEPSLSSPTELIVVYNTFEKNIEREAAKRIGQLKKTMLEDEAKEQGRIVRLEVLAKSVERSRGHLRLRIINESSDKIDFLHLQVEMTLLGTHAGYGTSLESSLLPYEKRIVEITSRDELEEGFDDYVITISKQPSNGYYAIEVER